MDFKGENGEAVRVAADQQTDEALVGALTEIVEVARERNLELPAGEIAVKGSEAQETTELTTREKITQQLQSAIGGYREAINEINKEREDGDDPHVEVEEADISNELEEWLTEEKIAQIEAAQEANPKVEFTLVATPNITVAREALLRIARGFADGQPSDSFISEDLLREYDGHELSGTHPENGNNVQFSLIPDSTDSKFSGSVSEQNTQLDQLRRLYPHARVPSVLEAEVYKRTLRIRQGGGPLAGEGTEKKTSIRHFDLKPRGITGWRNVPNSKVNDKGQSWLSTSRPGPAIPARICVG